MLEKIDDFYFRNWGFRKKNKEFAKKSIHNYNMHIRGGKSDSKSMQRYIKRLKRHFKI